MSPELLRALHEMSELDVAVAFETGIRGSPCSILVDELLDDSLPELDLHVDGVEWHADRGARRSGVIHRRNAAARIGAVIFILR